MLALDNIQGYLIQLACAGGSGAIAKTAVAPLERVKVINARHAACASRVCCICVGVVNWHCRGQHSGHFLQMHSVKFNIVREFVFAVAQEQFPDKLRTSHKRIACHLHYVFQGGGCSTLQHNCCIGRASSVHAMLNIWQSGCSHSPFALQHGASNMCVRHYHCRHSKSHNPAWHACTNSTVWLCCLHCSCRTVALHRPQSAYSQSTCESAAVWLCVVDPAAGAADEQHASAAAVQGAAGCTAQDTTAGGWREGEPSGSSPTGHCPIECCAIGRVESDT